MNCWIHPMLNRSPASHAQHGDCAMPMHRSRREGNMLWWSGTLKPSARRSYIFVSKHAVASIPPLHTHLLVCNGVLDGNSPQQTYVSTSPQRRQRSSPNPPRVTGEGEEEKRKKEKKVHHADQMHGTRLHGTVTFGSMCGTNGTLSVYEG